MSSPAPATFTLCDLRVRTWGDTPHVAQMMRETLRYKGAEVDADPTAEPDVTLDFAVRPPPQALPASARRLGPSKHGDIWVWQDGDRTFLCHEENTVVILDPGDGRAYGSLDPALAAPAKRRRDPLFYLITFSLVILLRYRGWFALHAAALTREQGGVLLVAPGGSGKSTAALNLARQGWAYLSDDSVLLRAGGDRVRAHSFRSDFCVDPEAAAHFPELAERGWPPSLSDAAKWRVDLSQVYPGQFLEACVPRVLALPEIVEAKVSSLAPMEPQAMLGLLINQSALFLTPNRTIASRQLELLRRLVGQTDAYRLKAGRDLLEHPARVDELFASTLR